jgi:hypothetical protein
MSASMASLPDARLVIHGGASLDARARPAERPWDRLRNRLARLLVGRLRWAGPRPTEIRIQDLQGRPVFAADDIAVQIAVPLHAGTYHITTCRGGTRLQYTVTLTHGATCDLYPRLAAYRQSD